MSLSLSHIVSHYFPLFNYQTSHAACFHSENHWLDDLTTDGLLRLPSRSQLLFVLHFILVHFDFFFIIHKACIIWFCLRALKSIYLFLEMVGALWPRPHLSMFCFFRGRREEF